MPTLINPAIVGNWENWFRVFLMALLGFVVLDCAFALIHGKEVK